MKKIVRLTESDLTRIVRRVISEGNIPTKGDYLVQENYTSMGSGTNLYAFTSVGEPVAINDPKGKQYKSFKIKVSAVQYYNKDGTFSKVGNTSFFVDHRCGAMANFFGVDWNGGIADIDSGSAGYVSKMGGTLETKSNTYCKGVGKPNQKSLYAGS